MLVDRTWQGQPRKLMLWANRNGYFYVLDRVTGEFLSGTPFVKVNWASGLDAKGRPTQTPQPPAPPPIPAIRAAPTGTCPAYSPRTGLFYFSAWENYGTIYRPEESTYTPGQLFTGGGFSVVTPAPGAPTIGIGRRGPINNWTDEVGNGAVMAMDPETGQTKWKLRQFDVSDAGMLTTASDLLFTGGREGPLHGARRPHRRAALQGEPRRPDRDGAGHLHGGRQAVRDGHRRQRALHLRPARLTRTGISMRRLVAPGLAALLFAVVLPACSSPAPPPGVTPATLDGLATQALARLDGELQVPGLKAPVEILRDEAGIPHIYAQNDDDMFFAQGYVMAQDRLWQLEMWRRWREGRLAEIFGPAAYDFDARTRLMMFRGPWDEKEWTSYHPDAERLFGAWANGLNAYVAQHKDRLPVEFQLTGIVPEPWTAKTLTLRWAQIGLDSASARTSRRLLSLPPGARSRPPPLSSRRPPSSRWPSSSPPDSSGPSRLRARPLPRRLSSRCRSSTMNGNARRPSARRRPVGPGRRATRQPRPAPGRGRQRRRAPPTSQHSEPYGGCGEPQCGLLRPRHKYPARPETGLRFITHLIRLSDQAHLKANRLEMADGSVAGLEDAVVAEFERAIRAHVVPDTQP